MSLCVANGVRAFARQLYSIVGTMEAGGSSVNLSNDVARSLPPPSTLTEWAQIWMLLVPQAGGADRVDTLLRGWLSQQRLGSSFGHCRADEAEAAFVLLHVSGMLV